MRNSHALPARTTATRRFGALLALGACLLCAVMHGCTGSASSFENPAPYTRAYPDDLRQGDTLDVHVFRDVTRLRLTNTTTRVLGPGTLWINQWYSRPIDAIEPGRSISLRLVEFVDQYGEAMRPGGFFATERPDPVVQVQLEQPAREASAGDEIQLVGLIVVADRVE